MNKISNVSGYQTITYKRKIRDPEECRKNAIKAINARWEKARRV